MLPIPWLLGLALLADGWYLRQDIVWSKPNPMPESVTDRCTKAHEYLFLLAKSREYFYDADAIREVAIHAGQVVTLGEKSLSRGQANGAGVAASGDGKADSVVVADGRNKRSVWNIATAPYAAAHFATFPPQLVEPCIKAGTSERGCCPECGAPWERVTTVSYENPGNRSNNGPRPVENRAITAGFAQRLEKRSDTTGWQPTCAHVAEPVSCTVLDSFGGSGTTAAVAKHLGRRGVLVELNPKYCELAVERVGIGIPTVPVEIVAPDGTVWSQGVMLFDQSVMPVNGTVS